MDVAIAGGHGKVALRLAALLAARGDQVRSIVRNPDHVADVEARGVAKHVAGADAVVFAAGAGPGSGAERKRTVDHGAAVKLIGAAERTGVRGYLLISSMGVEQARRGTPRGMDPVFAAYLQAKLRAEDEILPRPALDVTIVRPGLLTDDPGTGYVTLGHGIERGKIPRDDVAAVLAEILRLRKFDD